MMDLIGVYGLFARPNGCFRMKAGLSFVSLYITRFLVCLESSANLTLLVFNELSSLKECMPCLLAILFSFVKSHSYVDSLGI